MPRKFIQWSACLVGLAILTGTLGAFFLWSMEQVTLQRFSNPWLIGLLPLAGMALGFYYRYHGKKISSGNAVILHSLHDTKQTVPPSLAPSIVLSTLITHLLGGSAGREGTAVQMGAGLSSLFRSFLTKSQDSLPLLTLCGMAGGFGAVFGTPIAGAIFAFEFAQRSIASWQLIPCLVTATMANVICHQWGVLHSIFPEIFYTLSVESFPLFFLQLSILGIIIALVSRLYLVSTEYATRKWERFFPHEAIRGGFGGLLVILLFLFVGISDYLGLGVIPQHPGSLTISHFLLPDTHAPVSAWMWKMVFTLITLSTGFKGGEVTPLFFIGAALGNTLAWWLAAPVDLFAAVSMVSLFAAATKTPIASIAMGMELFGWKFGLPLIFVVFLAVKSSGKASIYPCMKAA